MFLKLHTNRIGFLEESSIGEKIILEGGREAGREGGREAGREGGREAGRQGGRERGRGGGEGGK